MHFVSAYLTRKVRCPVSARQSGACFWSKIMTSTFLSEPVLDVLKKHVHAPTCSNVVAYCDHFTSFSHLRRPLNLFSAHRNRSARREDTLEATDVRRSEWIFEQRKIPKRQALCCRIMTLHFSLRLLSCLVGLCSRPLVVPNSLHQLLSSILLTNNTTVPDLVL